MANLQIVSDPVESKPQHKPFKRPIAEILTDLSRPIPDRLLQTRKQGSATLTYVPWINACKLLDFYAPGWCGAVTHVHTTADRLFLTYQISIFAEEGIFTREATGTELLKCGSYGDPSSNAESMAFRRAAAKFGLGLHLYEKD